MDNLSHETVLQVNKFNIFLFSCLEIKEVTIFIRYL